MVHNGLKMDGSRPLTRYKLWHSKLPPLRVILTPMHLSPTMAMQHHKTIMFSLTQARSTCQGIRNQPRATSSVHQSTLLCLCLPHVVLEFGSGQPQTDQKQHLPLQSYQCVSCLNKALRQAHLSFSMMYFDSLYRWDSLNALSCSCG
jgi:hypothetical protein